MFLNYVYLALCDAISEPVAAAVDALLPRKNCVSAFAQLLRSLFLSIEFSVKDAGAPSNSDRICRFWVASKQIRHLARLVSNWGVPQAAPPELRRAITRARYGG